MNSVNRLSLLSVLSGFVLLMISSSNGLEAQPVINAKNMALGGGGTAYLNGYEANFYNPANLMIYDHRGRFHFGVGDMGLFYEPVLSKNNIKGRFDTFSDVYLPYSAGSEAITPYQRQTILNANYSDNDVISRHQTRFDFVLGGLQWQGDQKAYSIALRARSSTRIEVGRGWYSSDFIQNGNKQIRDFTLGDQHQVLYELSLGYAQEFEFINGLMPKISKLYIGIAPKFIMGGAYMNATYSGRYQRDDESSPTQFVHQIDYQSSGAYSRVVKEYMNDSNVYQAIERNMNHSFSLAPTGYGMGFDFGLTYMIPIRSDVSILDSGNNRKPIQNSIRLSLSLTDLGLIWYDDTPLSLNTGREALSAENQPPADNRFVGSPGQYPAYFDDAPMLPNPFTDGNIRSENNFSTLLPTSINAGALLELQRFRLMGDLTLGLNKTAFTDTHLTARLGMEVRALPFLPIRLGTRFAANSPFQLGLGGGLETRYFDFNMSTLFLIGSKSSGINGGAVAGLLFHL